MRLYCVMIVRPYSRSHSQTLASKASRPRSWRLFLLLQLLLDDALRGDAGVVVPRLEQAVEALHAPPADERVGERELERVAHVQLTGDVRRRERDDERRPRIVGLCRVQALLLPGGLPALFDALGAVPRFHPERW